MAKLSSHGTEIGRLRYTTTEKAYFADGAVLRRVVGDWKLYAKVKAGIDPHQAFETARARQADFLARRPALAAYRAALHDLAGMGKAWKLHMAVQMMPQDPDGVWSEACDGYGDNVHADLDDVVSLCRLYEAAIAESQAQRNADEMDKAAFC